MARHIVVKNHPSPLIYCFFFFCCEHLMQIVFGDSFGSQHHGWQRRRLLTTALEFTTKPCISDFFHYLISSFYLLNLSESLRATLIRPVDIILHLPSLIWRIVLSTANLVGEWSPGAVVSLVMNEEQQIGDSQGRWQSRRPSWFASWSYSRQRQLILIWVNLRWVCLCSEESERKTLCATDTYAQITQQIHLITQKVSIWEKQKSWFCGRCLQCHAQGWSSTQLTFSHHFQKLNESRRHRLWLVFWKHFCQSFTALAPLVNAAYSHSWFSPKRKGSEASLS